jgi:hypothetical protein
MSFGPLFESMGQMATAILEECPDRCVVMARSQSVDTRGGKRDQWAAPRTPDYDLPCTYDLSSGHRFQAADREQAITVMKAWVPAMYRGAVVVVIAGDRLVIRARPPLPVLTWQIEFVGRREGVQIELLCTEVN